jgi:hypothetical protein
MEHIDDHDLERFYLGMVEDESELERIESHLLWCPSCVERAEATEAYVDASRAAIVVGNWDLHRQ